MVLVVKDYFEGSSNVTKTYQEDMMGFKVTNDHTTTDLTFTIHGITIKVKPKETFQGEFAPFRTIIINSTIPFRAIVTAPFNGTQPDTTPPEDVTNLSTSNLKANSLTLSWTPSTSSDAVSYDIFQNGEFLASVTSTNMEVTGLTPLTQYTFRIVAKDSSGNTSDGTQTTVTTAAADTTPPILTITPGGTFTNSKTVTMTTDESATIYYTLDGTEPTTSSSVYSVPLTLTGTTTVKAFAKDSTGNKGTIQTVTYTKIVMVTNGLVLHYDFTNKAGTTSNTILDTVNNVPATLVNVSHDSVNDGYIENKGLLLQTSDYISIPTNTSPLNNIIDINKGITIEVTSYDTNGILFRTDNDKLRMFVNANVNLWNVNYLANDQSVKSTSFTVSHVIKPSIGNIAINNALNKQNSNAINTITLRINQNHTMNIFVNGLRNYQQYTIPTDLVTFVNTLAETPLHLRRNIVGINTIPTTLSRFSIYNRALTDEEVIQNYSYNQSGETLQKVTAYPSEVTLQPGENQILAVVGTPSKYTSLLTAKYESENKEIATIDENGLITGIKPGETVIKVVSSFEEQTFTNYVNVKIGVQTSTPSSTRRIDGMSINRSTNTLEVGENYAVMATALSSGLPYDILNDNIVLWESSNPSIVSINYGVLEGVSEGTATITAYDGTKTYFKGFNLTVTKPTEAAITAEDTINVSLDVFKIKSDNTDSTNTTDGIQSALDFAASNSYKKIVFPKGTYLVNPEVRTIKMPNNMIVDFNNSIINIEPSSLTAKGYTMILFNNTSNTKLINVKIFGEADSTTVQQSVENCVSVAIRENCFKSGLENCTISKSPGFNILTANKLVKDGTSGSNISKDNFEPGNIDASGNIDNTITVNYYRSINYINVSGLGDYYMLGYNQGFNGYPHLRSRLYSIHFYNESFKHIESQMYNLQFYNYKKPDNAKYAKLVIYQGAAPTTQDGDFNAIAFLRTVAMPKKCFVKDCIIENNFSTGLAMCGGEDWLIEGNTFSNNGGRMPGCDIDWEDGWENMIGDITKNNNFNSLSGVIFSAGASLALFNNTFNNSNLISWGRTQNYRVFNNKFQGNGSTANDFKTQGDSVLARNIFTDGATYKTGIHHTGANYKVHTLFNTIV